MGIFPEPYKEEVKLLVKKDALIKLPTEKLKQFAHENDIPVSIYHSPYTKVK